MGDQHDFSLTSNLEGWDEEYSLKECKKFFDDSDNISSKQHEEGWGWVFWTTANDPRKLCSSEPYGGAIRDEFKHLLEDLVDSTVSWPSYLIQFWVPKVVGGKHYLTTSDQPFAVGWYLRKGLCWYRKHCVDYSYFVGELGGKEEEIGPLGRVFRDGYPELSPDLRLYSVTEHPLRDHAARCGARGYIALPLFDLIRNQCIGVLELLTFAEGIGTEFKSLDEALKKRGFRSTHIGWPSMYKNPICEQKLHASEFTEMLEMAIDAVPELHLAQVWIPCEQCAYTTGSNLSCMRRAAFRLAAKNSTMHGFSDVCGFHNVPSQKGIAGIVFSSTNKSCFCRNLCDLSISEYPLSHHAQRARLSSYFAICLQSVNNSDYLCVVEFFFHPDCSEDAYPWSLLHLLFQIIEKKLLGFKVASGRKLGEGVVEEVGIRNNMPASCELGFSQSNVSPSIQQKKHHSPKEFTTVSTIAGYDKSYSFSDFLEYLQKPDLCSSTPSKDNSRHLFWTMGREELPEYGSNIRILLQENTVRRSWDKGFEGLVQFWALKRVENRSYLSTSDQPFAVTSLHRGLCWYRKQCMDHQYFVNEEAKEEELGPLGRVFRNRYSECSPDLRLYSAKEFPLRDNAARCGLRYYLALPIFDLHEEQCVGVLEYVGFSYANWKYELGRVKEALEATNLKSSHIKVERPFFKKSDQELALTEIMKVLRVATQASQLFLAQVWAPCSKCDGISNSLSCMECVVFKNTLDEGFHDLQACQFQKVQSGKGIAGTVLASESKSCFYPNLCDFSIKEEPRAHHARRDRLDVCFAICLQSSYTGNKIYILEFFLDKCTRRCEHLCSFLYFLLSTMKEKLKSFKVASGKQLGDEMVVEVVTFGKNNDFTSSGSSQPHVSPFRFEITQHGPKMECPHRKNEVADAEQNNITTTDLDEGVTITTKISKRRKDEMDFGSEDLEHCFGKKLKDIKNELPVGTSTSKHACKECGIERSPSNATKMTNSSLFETSIANESKSIQHITKAMDVDFVIVQAKFNDDIVKFELCLSSGMKNLTEEVARRLDLKIGSFKLKYVDEDDHLILLACDDDLQFCIKTLTSLGKTPIQVLVQSICNCK